MSFKWSIFSCKLSCMFIVLGRFGIDLGRKYLELILSVIFEVEEILFWLNVCNATFVNSLYIFYNCMILLKLSSLSAYWFCADAITICLIFDRNDHDINKAEHNINLNRQDKFGYYPSWSVRILNLVCFRIQGFGTDLNDYFILLHSTRPTL